MKITHLLAAAVMSVMATSAGAVTLNVVGGTSVAPETGNFQTLCSDGNTTCYNPLNPVPGVTPGLQALQSFFTAASYPGLTVSPQGEFTIKVTFVGAEAASEGSATTFGLMGQTLSNRSAIGTSFTAVVSSLLDGLVPFGFSSTIGSTAGSNGFSNSGAIAFSSVFNNGSSVYAFFDDNGGLLDRDWDDMIVRIDVAPVPLPAAAWMLLLGVGGLYGMRRLRSAA